MAGKKTGKKGKHMMPGKKHIMPDAEMEKMMGQKPPMMPKPKARRK